MAHSVVWGYLLIQRQNKNLKKLMDENVSGSSLRGYTKFGWAYLSDEEEIRLSLIGPLMWDSGFNVDDVISSKY